MDWGRLFFSAYGRIRRQEFWISFLVLMGVSPFVQELMIGLVIIIAVGLDKWTSRKAA